MEEGASVWDNDYTMIAAALLGEAGASMRRDTTNVLPRVRGLARTVDELGEAEAWIRKGDLARLYKAMEIPTTVWRCTNGSIFSGETGILFLLRRLRCGSYPHGLRLVGERRSSFSF